MIKLIIVFILGIVETYLYTWYLIAVDKRQPVLSSFLMFIYMVFYLAIIAWAIKDTNTILMLLTYASAAGVGNYIKLLQEKLPRNYWKKLIKKYRVWGHQHLCIDCINKKREQNEKNKKL